MNRDMEKSADIVIEQRNRIAKLEAVVELAKLVASGPRIDERFFHGIHASKRIMQELDEALKALEKE